MYNFKLNELEKFKGIGNRIPLYREIIADLETPVSIFLKIRRGGYSFLLESIVGGDRARCTRRVLAC